MARASTLWPPLPPAEPVHPVQFQNMGSYTVQGDVRSHNWDGGDGVNTGATVGFLLHAATGSAEFMDGFFRGSVSADSITTGAILGQTITIGLNAGASIIIQSDAGTTNIRSSNYSAGSAGWQISRNGSAEFNDVTVRGILEASLFRTATSGERLVINGDTGEAFLRVYDGGGELGRIGVDTTAYGADVVVFQYVPGFSGGGGDGFQWRGSPSIVMKLTNENGVDPARLFVPNGILDSGIDYPGLGFMGAHMTGLWNPSSDIMGLIEGGVECARTNGANNTLAFVNMGTTASAANAHLTASNVLLKSTSSERGKADLRPWDFRASVLDLAPTLFRSIHKADDSRRVRLGLIAEDVAAVFPLAALMDDTGAPQGIDWAVITAGLIGEVQRLEERITRLEAAAA